MISGFLFCKKLLVTMQNDLYNNSHFVKKIIIPKKSDMHKFDNSTSPGIKSCKKTRLARRWGRFSGFWTLAAVSTLGPAGEEI